MVWRTFHLTQPLETAGIYWRADLGDVEVLDGRDDRKRATLIAERLKEWEAFRNG